MSSNTHPLSHLGYCTNIHPGESLAEVRASLEHHVLAVKRRLSPHTPFPVGLRLSARAARELERPAELRDWLRANGLYVFSLNGFPYGAFHGPRIKERVYDPDWRDYARLAYSDRLADVLAALLPDGVDGTVSTVPGGFHASRGDEREMARHLLAHAAHLHALYQRTGKSICLALEPEPCCHLSTTADAVGFFERNLFSPAAVDRLAQLTGTSAAQAEDALHRHLGVCVDACHLAVEHEDPGAALGRLAGAGIRVAKVQISTGLEALVDCEEARAALRPFAEDVYLHQVVVSHPGGLAHFLDLPDALARAPDGIWRVHFHVPIFRERLGRFRNTQRELAALLAAARGVSHFEVETYSWGMLPRELRSPSVVDDLCRELDWAREHLP